MSRARSPRRSFVDAVPVVTALAIGTAGGGFVGSLPGTEIAARLAAIETRLEAVARFDTDLDRLEQRASELETRVSVLEKRAVLR